MSGTADNNGNSKRRVANYELHSQLSEVNSNVVHLIQRFDEYCERADKRHDDHEERLRTVEKSITTLDTKVKERQGVWAVIQGTFTILMSSLSAYIGTKQ